MVPVCILLSRLLLVSLLNLTALNKLTKKERCFQVSFVVRQNNHISSSVKSWRVWGNWVLNEPSWIEKSWVTIGQNECESVHSLHTASVVSFFTFCIHYPKRRVTCSWTQTAEQDLRSRSATAVLKMHHLHSLYEWMNESVKGWMKETEQMNERWGREGCSVMRYPLGPAHLYLFFLPLPLLSDWLRGFSAAGRYCSHVGVTPLPPHHNLCSLWMKVGKIEWKNGLHVSELCVLT